jgi:Rad52/22 family double-strand break repair protein
MTQVSPDAQAVMTQELLQARFADNEHKTNHQGMTYVEDETVMDRLDEVLGFGHWGTSTQIVTDRDVIVTLRVQDPSTKQWVEYSDYGNCTNPGSSDMLKEAWTDGFRRVARQPGVARYVYAGEVGAPASTYVPAPPAGSGAAPVYADVPFQTATAPAAPPQPVAVPQSAPVGFGDTCPVHGWAWSIQKGGVAKGSGKPYPPFYKCGGKTVAGAFCSEKPSDEWIAAHPIA